MPSTLDLVSKPGNELPIIVKSFSSFNFGSEGGSSFPAINIRSPYLIDFFDLA